MPTTQIIEVLPQVGATQELIVNTLSQLTTTPRSGLTIAFCREEKGGGDRFSYFPESSNLTPDGGVVISAQDGGYWVRRINGREILSSWWGEGIPSILAARDFMLASQSTSQPYTKLKLKENSLYELESQLVFQNMSIDIDMNGSTFLFKTPIAANAGIIRFRNTNFELKIVTAVEDVQNRTVITLNNIDGLKKGDVIKLVSNDDLPLAPIRSSGAAAKGEMLVINLIDGINNTITTTSRTIYNYTPGTHATRISLFRNTRVSIKNGILDAVRGHETGDLLFLNFIEFTQQQNPIVENITVKYGYNSMLWFFGCYAYKVHNFHVESLENNDDAQIRGYGIRSTNSESGIVTSSSFKHCRHGFVSITQGSGTSTDTQQFGHDAHHVISDCVGIGCTNSPFDTHHGSYNVAFNNCKSYNSRFSGFQLRGVKNQLNNCQSFNDWEGAYLFIQRNYSNASNQVAKTLDNVINNFICHNPYTRAIRNEADGKNYVNGYTVIIDRDRLSSVGLFRNGRPTEDGNLTPAGKFYCTNGRIVLKGGVNFTKPVFEILGNSRHISISQLTLDLDDYVNTAVELVGVESTNPYLIEISGLNVIQKEADPARFSRLIEGLGGEPTLTSDSFLENIFIQKTTLNSLIEGLNVNTLNLYLPYLRGQLSVTSLDGTVIKYSSTYQASAFVAYAKSSLPAAAGRVNTLAMISDPTAGKGRTVYSDGTNWKYVSDDSVV
jgi:hypothetical protein